MKIKSISREFCEEDNVALITEPKLTGQVYEKFRQMLEILNRPFPRAAL